MEYSNRRSVGIVILLLVVVGCSSESDMSGPGGQGGSAGGAGGGMAGTKAGSAGTSGAGGLANGDAGTAGGPVGTDAAAVGNCSPPADIYNPIPSLTLTGCMDPKDPTKPVSRAVPYEVNS